MNIPLTPAELTDKLSKEARTISLSRNRIERIAQQTLPPAVQEVVLAQRHLEDAFTRLQVAINKANNRPNFVIDEKEA